MLLARNFEFTKTPRESFLAALDCCLGHPTSSHIPSGASLKFRGLWLLVRRCSCPQVKCKRLVGGCFSSHFVHPNFTEFVFWRVCVFRLRVRYGYGSLAELTQDPGTRLEVLHSLEVRRTIKTNLLAELKHQVLQNSQKVRVDTRMLYRYPYPHPGIFTAYPYPEYSATGAQNIQEFRVRAIPRVWFCTYPTEHSLLTLQKFRVQVRQSYRTHRSSG